MFKNLQILMINNNISENDIALTLNLTMKAVQNRFNGITDFKRIEMLEIKKKYFPNYTLDQLFDNDVNLIKN